MLSSAGLQAHGATATEPPTGSLLLYSSPDQVLLQRRLQGGSAARIAQTCDDYRQLIAWSADRKLLASWRLEGLEPASVAAWVNGHRACPTASAPLPSPDPLTALVALSLLEDHPDLLDLYLDLELQAELAGTPVDTHYLERLQHQARGEALQQQWWTLDDLVDIGTADSAAPPTAMHPRHPSSAAWLEERQTLIETSQQTAQQNELLKQEVLSLQQQLSVAHSETDLAAQQMIEVQGELETLQFSQQDLRRQLEDCRQQLRVAQAELSEVQELAATRAAFIQTLQQQHSDAQQALQQLQGDLGSSRQEADLALEQLRQVQSELEELQFSQQQLRAESEDLRREQIALRRERQDLTEQLSQDCTELDLTRSRLQEASRELERYELLTREQAQLLNRQNQLTGKALRLAAEAPPPG